VAILAGILTIAATAIAQPADDADELELDGNVRLGLQGLVLDGDEAKFNEYRTLPEDFGFAAEEVLLRGYKGPYHFLVEGLDLDREDDRSARVEGGRYGKFQLGFGWDQTPHHFAEDVPFLGTWQGDGVWGVLDPVRRDWLQDETRFPLGQQVLLGDLTREFPSDEGKAGLLDFLRLTPRLDLGLLRETYTVDLEYTAFEDFDIRANYLHLDQEGLRAMSTGVYRRVRTGAEDMFPGTGVGENFTLYGLEFPEPIDYDTNEFSAGVHYRRENWQADLSYRFAAFDNDISTVTWDNPLLLEVINAGHDYEGVPYGTALNRLDLFPSYNKHALSFTGGIWDLPFNSRFTTTASWSLVLQDDDFLAYTVNDELLVNGGPNAGLPGATLALPANDLDGEVNTIFVNALLSSRPIDPLSLDFRVNYYSYMNDSDKIHWVDGWARIGESEWGATSNWLGAGNELFNRVPDWWRIRPSVDASYKVNKMLLLLADYSFEGYRRNGDRNADTNEHRVGGRVKLTPTSWSSLRVGYHWADREIDGSYSPQPAKQFFEWDQLRMFDQSDRTRNSVDAYLSVDPIEPLSLGFAFDWRLDEYDKDFYGLQERDGYMLGVDASYVISDRATIFAYYTRDDYDADSKLRTKSDETGRGSFEDAGNDFLTTIDDITNTIGGRVSLNLIPDKLTFDVSADYSFAKSEFDNSNPNPTSGLPCDPPAPGTCQNTTSGATAFDWPDAKIKTTQVRADLEYHWTDRLSTGFRYLYQRFDLNDSFTDDVLPYGNPDDLQGNTLDYFIFMDANYSDYDAHLFTLTVAYEF
jgi:MtrB/PioB family decaheme-associated outer membrane protein